MYLTLIACLINLLPLEPTNVQKENQLRPSITFILGEDQKGSNPYYSLAKQYYLYNPNHKHNYYVDTCRSMVAVRNHLAENLPTAAAAWGQITIVVHSNQWTGISVPVTEGGQRTTVNSLFESIQTQEFQALPNSVVDQETIMDFKACGLGTNKDLLKALAVAFGGFDKQPTVQSSENFIYYYTDEHQHIQSKHFKPYYAFYKTAFKHVDSRLAKQFQEHYPSVAIDWLSAIQNKQPRWKDDTFHHRFNVPIEWYVYVDKDLTTLNFDSAEKKVAFVKAQPELMKIVKNFHIPIDKFRWTFVVEKEEGVATVLIKGKATVLCVLEEMK